MSATRIKVLTCIKPRILAYQEIDMPILKPGESLVKIKRIGICGTDLHAFEGTQPYFNYPRVLGHELSGELILPNGAEGFEPNEAITISPYFYCGKCVACRNGKNNCCINMQVCGVHIDGGMAEYFSVPHSYLVHGNGLNFDELALIEPLAIGAHGVRRAAIDPGEYILVIGAGPIGLGTMEFARIAGGKVIAMDMVQKRLDHCREKLKVKLVINASTDDVMACLHKITGGDMPTVVIDCTGSQQAINDGFKYIAHGGRYVIIGLQKGDICFSHPEFHKREATLLSSRNATRADLEFVIHSLKKGWVDPANYISHRVGFNEIKNEFESWLDPKNGVIKAIVEL